MLHLLSYSATMSDNTRATLETTEDEVSIPVEHTSIDDIIPDATVTTKITESQSLDLISEVTVINPYNDQQKQLNDALLKIHWLQQVVKKQQIIISSKELNEDWFRVDNECVLYCTGISSFETLMHL
jgi:hypothetical protein